MRFYRVHVRPARPADDPDIVLVKEGFCWPALFVPLLWALWHRLWLGAVLYVAAGTLLGALLLPFDFNDLGDGVIAAAYAVLVASVANDWRRRSLARRGYRLVAVLAARRFAEAEARAIHALAPA